MSSFTKLDNYPVLSLLVLNPKSPISILAGEAAPETLAKGQDMVVQELVEIRGESNARCCVEQGLDRPGDGAVVKAPASGVG